MISRDLVEENLAMLLPVWRELRDVNSPGSHLRFGIGVDMASQVATLDEIQVRRAADVATPLFRSDQPDAILIRALQDPSSGEFPPLDQLDRVIREQNEVFLVNRWASARRSAVEAQCLFGLSSEVIACLQQVTLSDLHRASRRGVRFAAIGPRPRYFFHAGRHVTLTTSMRTTLAACSSTCIRG